MSNVESFQAQVHYVHRKAENNLYSIEPQVSQQDKLTFT